MVVIRNREVAAKQGVAVKRGSTVVLNVKMLACAIEETTHYC